MQRIVSRREATTARETLAQLEKRYAAGKISRGSYLYQREALHKIIALPVRKDTEVKTNTKTWFARNWINNSPAPVGYFNFQQPNTDAIKPPATVGSEMSKISSGLLNLAQNDYWNDNDLQQAIRQQSGFVNEAGNSLNQQALTNSNQISSNFSQAIAHANNLNQNLGRTAGATTNQIVSSLVNQPQVQAELRVLQESLVNLIRERVANGSSPYAAKDELISLAIQSGAKITEMGYDPEAASEIVTKLIKGEITELNAIYKVASDLREANKILNSLGSRNNSSIGPNSGLLDQIYATPLPTGQRFIPPNYNPHNMTPRAPAVAAQNRGSFNNYLRSQRQKNGNGLSNDSQMRNNLANQAMPTTRRALNLQKPDLATILKDIFTVDGNLFFNHQQGELIELVNGAMNNNLDYVRPAGMWTVYGMSKQYAETLEGIRQSLLYTLVPDYWTDSERTYIEYLINKTQRQMIALQETDLAKNYESPVLVSNPVFTSQNITNSQTNNAVSQIPQTPNSPTGNGVSNQLNANQNMASNSSNNNKSPPMFKNKGGFIDFKSKGGGLI